MASKPAFLIFAALLAGAAALLAWSLVPDEPSSIPSSIEAPTASGESSSATPLEAPAPEIRREQDDDGERRFPVPLESEDLALWVLHQDGRGVEGLVVEVHHRPGLGEGDASSRALGEKWSFESGADGVAIWKGGREELKKVGVDGEWTLDWSNVVPQGDPRGEQTTIDAAAWLRGPLTITAPQLLRPRVSVLDEHGAPLTRPYQLLLSHGPADPRVAHEWDRDAPGPWLRADQPYLLRARLIGGSDFASLRFRSGEEGSETRMLTLRLGGESTIFGVRLLVPGGAPLAKTSVRATWNGTFVEDGAENASGPLGWDEIWKTDGDGILNLSIRGSSATWLRGGWSVAVEGYRPLALPIDPVPATGVIELGTRYLEPHPILLAGHVRNADGRGRKGAKVQVKDHAELKAGRDGYFEWRAASPDPNQRTTFQLSATYSRGGCSSAVEAVEGTHGIELRLHPLGKLEGFLALPLGVTDGDVQVRVRRQRPFPHEPEFESVRQSRDRRVYFAWLPAGAFDLDVEQKAHPENVLLTLRDLIVPAEGKCDDPRLQRLALAEGTHWVRFDFEAEQGLTSGRARYAWRPQTLGAEGWREGNFEPFASLRFLVPPGDVEFHFTSLNCREVVLEGTFQHEKITWTSGLPLLLVHTERNIELDSVWRARLRALDRRPTFVQHLHFGIEEGASQVVVPAPGRYEVAWAEWIFMESRLNSALREPQLEAPQPSMTFEIEVLDQEATQEFLITRPDRDDED